MRQQFQCCFAFLCLLLMKNPQVSAQGAGNRDYHNSRAGKAAWEGVQKPDDIEPYMHPRDYDPNKPLVSNDPNLVGFWLYYDPEDPEKHDVIVYDNLESLEASHYSSALPTKFLIHGFQSSGMSSFPQNSKNAYLTLQAETPYNIIAVDWGELSMVNTDGMGAGYYSNVVENVVVVGTRVGQFIAWLHRLRMVDLKKVHIIGFSLGSHISGVAADFVKKYLQQTVGRVTGLDPAGPSFYSGNASRRLQPDDADFVDAIHTNAGLLGIMKDVGQVDYYANSGTQQPGCFSYPSMATSIKGTLTGLCSHLRATQYWTKSILDGPNAKSCACSSFMKYMMNAKCCEAEVTLGEYCAPGSTGSYYVRYVIE